MQKIHLPGRCYWVIENRFLAGNYPYNPGIDEPEEFLRVLLANGINAFVDLTEEDELPHYQPVLTRLTHNATQYRRFAIQDFSTPDQGCMRQAVNCINELLDAGNCVYLHCRGGIGRTGTVVGCWLRSQGMTGEQALHEVSRLFSASNAARFTRSPETDEQRQLVLSYDHFLRE
ncbi:MAG TPA: dual specificity protein phosphatase family protein [Candidatus Rifleibacterium sp.]|nr:dual specificity protein phosphatase family protein [Candidatus Rifleibacterium sp.]HPT44275.1 dual specificity protein phosphatase family protein [Candidatus Rifleibacterium sp.]